MSILGVLAEDKKIITYRPTIVQMIGNIHAAILLQQIIYWYEVNEHEVFYKFAQPCDHPNYRIGDSWCEELVFSPNDLRTAMSKIGTRVKESKVIETLQANTEPIWNEQGFLENTNYLVVYYMTLDRKTYYALNEPLCEKALTETYQYRTAQIKAGIPCICFKPRGNVQPPSDEARAKNRNYHRNRDPKSDNQTYVSENYLSLENRPTEVWKTDLLLYQRLLQRLLQRLHQRLLIARSRNFALTRKPNRNNQR